MSAAVTHVTGDVAEAREPQRLWLMRERGESAGVGVATSSACWPEVTRREPIDGDRTIDAAGFLTGLLDDKLPRESMDTSLAGATHLTSLCTARAPRA